MQAVEPPGNTLPGRSQVHDAAEVGLAMKNSADTLLVRAWLTVLVSGSVLSLVGCSDNSKVGKVLPVSGKVKWGGEPLTAGIVTFTPDVNRANSSPWTASG